MKILNLLFLSLLVYSCALPSKTPPHGLSANPDRVLHSTYGKNPPSIPIDGYGYITSSSVVLNKNLPVNYAIGNCPVRYKGSWFGVGRGRLRPNMACSPENTSRHKLFIRPIEKGKTLKDSLRRRHVGYSVSNSVEAVRFQMNEVGTSHRCFFIATRNGHPVPVRPGTDIESYLFTNPLLIRAMKQRDLASDVREAERQIQVAERNILSAGKYLKNSPNFQGGQCIALKQRSLPSKPKGMAYAAAKEQAEMACVDLLASRHEVRAVYEAFGAIGRRDLMHKHMVWAKKSPPSCTRIQVSQFGNFVCDVFGAISPHAFRSCVQDAFQSCQDTVVDQCQGGLRSWQARVNEIVQEPEKNRRACQRRKYSLDHEKGRLLSLKQNLEQAQLTAQSAFTEPALETLALEQARCIY